MLLRGSGEFIFHYEGVNYSYI